MSTRPRCGERIPKHSGGSVKELFVRVWEMNNAIALKHRANMEFSIYNGACRVWHGPGADNGIDLASHDLDLIQGVSGYDWCCTRQLSQIDRPIQNLTNHDAVTSHIFRHGSTSESISSAIEREGHLTPRTHLPYGVVQPIRRNQYSYLPATGQACPRWKALPQAFFR